MPFTDQQTRQLKAKLDAQNVKTRKAGGATLSYIEGWHAIAEANRIFGFDGWDRRTLFTNCIWTGTCERDHLAAYVAKVRIYVRAGDALIVREGSGTGEGKAPTPGQAHEIALKSAETDATKRALATFGNVFGLALYDREQAGVRHPAKAKASEGPWSLRSATGADTASFAKPDEFVSALRQAMGQATDIAALFDLWGHNVATVRELNSSRKKLGLEAGFATALVAHLKASAVALVKVGNDPASKDLVAEPAESAEPRVPERQKIDKSVLTIGAP